MSAKHAVDALERRAPFLEGVGDRFSGYSVVGLPFRSGHILALRRFPASSLGPGYTSVWHRDPAGRWTFYSTVPPELSCARYFGGQVDRNVVTPIDIAWQDPMRFRVAVGTVIEWHVALRASLTSRMLNLVAAAIPERVWQHPALLRLLGLTAQATLATGRLNLTGLTPNGHRFTANPRRCWPIASTHAVVGGVDLGPAGPLPEQAALGDLLIPQAGVFAVARARFAQPLDRARVRSSCAFAEERKPIASAPSRAADRPARL